MKTSPYPPAFDRRIFSHGAESEEDCNQQLASMFGLQGKFFYYSAARMGLYEVLSCMSEMRPERCYIITCAFTCSVVINAIKRAGLTPLFIDISRNDLGPSVDDVLGLISEYGSNILGIIAQHSLGIPADLSIVRTACTERDIFLIEDCATTLGVNLDGSICGNLGDAAIFSFDTSKPVSVGVGGLLLVHSPAVGERVAKRYIAMSIQPRRHYVFLRVYRLLSSIEVCHRSFLAGLIARYVLALAGKYIFDFYGYRDSFGIDTLSREPYYPSRVNSMFFSHLLRELQCFRYSDKIRERAYNLLSSQEALLSFYPRNWSYGAYPSRLLVRRRSRFFAEVSRIQSQLHHWFRPLIQGDASAVTSYSGYELPVSKDVSEHAATFIPNKVSVDILSNV